MFKTAGLKRSTDADLVSAPTWIACVGDGVLSLRRYEALWGYLASGGWTVAGLRVPGPSVDVVRGRLGGWVPEAVAEWFSWCDGVLDGPSGAQGETYLLPGYWPLGLDEALSIRAGFDGLEPALGDLWVPLLGSGDGAFYAAAVDAGSGRERVLSVGEAEIGTAYSSVDAMLDGILHLYRSGIFFRNADGDLDADFERWVEFEG